MKQSSPAREVPGEWHFRTRVELSFAFPISFSEALNRCVKAWWRGPGAGFPIASLFTLAKAHGRLRRDVIAAWDKGGGFVVSHETIGAGRVLATVAYFAELLLLSVAGSSSRY